MAISSLVWSLCSAVFDPLRNPVLISMTLRVGWVFVFIIFFFRIHITLIDFIIRKMSDCRFRPHHNWQ